jgi:hypothetical protein
VSQQINLLNPAFGKKRVVASLLHVAVAAASTLVIMALIHANLQLAVSRQTAALTPLQTKVRLQQAEIDKLKATATGAVQKNTSLDSEIARLETELKAARDSVNALNAGALGNQQGFAEYLRAFSRQSLAGLWLTAFTIQGNGELTLQGRVTNPDLIASYIQRLKQEKILQGRTFATLDVRQPKVVAAEPGKAAAEKTAARFLEFTLTTVEPAASGPVAAVVAATERVR